MSSNFDIEAAKRGEPVEISWKGKWVKSHFVGVTVADRAVIQRETIGFFTEPFVCHQSELRMAPKKIKVRWRDAVLRNEKGVFISTCNEHLGPVPEIYESWNSFVKWIHTDWQEAEIDQ